MSKGIFDEIRVFNPDTLLEDMLAAEEGTVFMLGEKHIPNHEGDDTVEMTFVQIMKSRDTPPKVTNTRKDRNDE